MVLTIPLPLHPPLPEPLSLQSPEPDPNPNPYLEPHNPYTHQAVVRLARGKKAAAKAKAKARRVLSPAELSAPAKQLIAQLTSKEAQPVESLPNSPPPFRPAAPPVAFEGLATNGAHTARPTYRGKYVHLHMPLMCRIPTSDRARAPCVTTHGWRRANEKLAKAPDTVN